jgi:hypothetical protein
VSSKTDTITIYLQQNDVFGFYIETLDGIGGSASVVISDFKFDESHPTANAEPLVLPTKNMGESPFIVAEPEVGTDFEYTYTSSDDTIASFDGNLLNINGYGYAQITITQKTKFYNVNNAYILLPTKTFYGILTVNNNSQNTPARIYNDSDWEYFLTKNVRYAMLMNNIDIISNNLTTPSSIQIIIVPSSKLYIE